MCSCAVSCVAALPPSCLCLAPPPLFALEQFACPCRALPVPSRARAVPCWLSVCGSVNSCAPFPTSSFLSSCTCAASATPALPFLLSLFAARGPGPRHLQAGARAARCGAGCCNQPCRCSSSCCFLSSTSIFMHCCDTLVQTERWSAWRHLSPVQRRHCVACIARRHCRIAQHIVTFAAASKQAWRGMTKRKASEALGGLPSTLVQEPAKASGVGPFVVHFPSRFDPTGDVACEWDAYAHSERRNQYVVVARTVRTARCAPRGARRTPPVSVTRTSASPPTSLPQKSEVDFVGSTSNPEYSSALPCRQGLFVQCCCCRFATQHAAKVRRRSSLVDLPQEFRLPERPAECIVLAEWSPCRRTAIICSAQLSSSTCLLCPPGAHPNVCHARPAVEGTHWAGLTALPGRWR